MVVTNVPEDGKLKVTRSGGLYPWKLGETPVEVVGDHGHVLGMFSMGSTHTPEAADKTISWEDVWIETGLTTDELRKAGIRPGSLAVPHASHPRTGHFRQSRPGIGRLLDFRRPPRLRFAIGSPGTVESNSGTAPASDCVRVYSSRRGRRPRCQKCCQSLAP